MFWGQNQKSAREYNLVLDVGTGSIKAMLVFEDDGELHVAAKSYIRAKSGSIKGGLIKDIEAVAHAAKNAVDTVFELSGIKTDSVIFGVSGQLVESVTTTVHYDRAYPEQPLQAAELKNIIYRIIERSNEKLRAALRDKFNDEHPDIELIHAAVVEVQLDGYPIANPIGFQGKRLSLTIFNAYIPLVYASVLQSLASRLKLGIKSIAAQPYGVSKIFTGIKSKDDMANAIFVDIGHSATDLIVVKNNSVEGIQSFMVGGEDVTQAIMRGLKLPHDKAEAVKLDYSANKLGVKMTRQVEEVIKPIVSIWRDGIRLSLMEFSDIKIMGPSIYLSGGGAALPEMKKCLHTKAWWTELPFAKRPSISVIHPDSIENVVEEMPLEWSEVDIPPLGIAKLTLKTKDKEDVVASTLQGIIRTLKNS